MNVIQTNIQLPMGNFGLPIESIEAIKKESRIGTVLYDLCCGEQNPKLSLGLPTEMICKIMENLDYLDAVKISKTIECDNSLNQIALAVHHAARRSIDYMSYGFKWIWDNKKSDAGKFLLRHYFRDLRDPADRDRFFSDLSKCCQPSPDLLSYILEALPEDTPSLDIDHFLWCLEPKHMDLITRRFFCLKSIPFPSPLKMEEFKASYDDVIIKIANNPNSQHLTTFEIKETTAAAPMAVANSSYMANLETLSISKPKSGVSEGLEALSQSRFLKNLKKLELSFFHEYTDTLCDDAFSLIANCENFQKLKVLHFEMVNLSDSIVENLVNSQNLSKIVELSIGRCERLTVRSVAAIAGSKQMSQLKILRFNINIINLDTCLQAIAESSFMMYLEALSLSCFHSVYSKRGITYIAESPFMANLKELNLDTHAAQIDSESAHKILRESKFTNQCIFFAGWRERMDHYYSQPNKNAIDL